MYFPSQTALNQHRSAADSQETRGWEPPQENTPSEAASYPPLLRRPHQFQAPPPQGSTYDRTHASYGATCEPPNSVAYPSLYGKQAAQLTPYPAIASLPSHVYPAHPSQALQAQQRDQSSITASQGATSLTSLSAVLPRQQIWHTSQHNSTADRSSRMQQPSSSAVIVSASDSPSLTYTGHIKTSADAVLLLAACDLPADASAAGSTSFTSPPPRRIQRRLLETERAQLVKSGSVFVWDEEEAGMRRWTDGRCWSASRVSACFLTYRELEARKCSPNDPTGPRTNQYKIDGLIKQSFSMTTTSGRKVHVVSYYTKRDVREGRLRRVSEDPRFVGEAGGEWGLQVDENEYPDPLIAMANPQGGQEDDEPESPAKASHPAVTGSQATCVGLSSSPAQSTTGSFPSTSIFVPPHFSRTIMPLTYLKRLSSDEEETRPSKTAVSRPPIKRLRSSSTSELQRLCLSRGGASLNLGASGNLLTESNMRSAGLESAQEQHQRQYEQQADQSNRLAAGEEGFNETSAGRDGSAAAGALLSLRSFFGPPSVMGRLAGQSRSAAQCASPGSAASGMVSGSNSTLRSHSFGSHIGLSNTRSYLDSSGSSGTCLTTPEDITPPSRPFDSAKQSAQMARRRSDGASLAGERNDSDKDTLRRLGVRV